MKKNLIIISAFALSCILLLSGCKRKETDPFVENWDKVTITYNSYLLDWEIIEEDQSETITIWLKESFPIFDTELLWLKANDEKTFTTRNPSEWYGIYYNELKVQEISSTVINTIWTEPKVWDQINLGSLKWIILDVNPVNVTIDFNDRQTRENVEFHVTILAIEEQTN